MTNIVITSELTVKTVDLLASDDHVVQSMLISTQGEDSLEAEATSGRINFLMRNRHGTPFEHTHFKFYIAAPIFVFREFHRHRIGWSYNEESGRYKQLDPKFYVPDPDRELVQVGKPGAYEYVAGDISHQVMVNEQLLRAYQSSYRSYEILLDHGIAKEVARMCLPVAIYSSMYATCNARSLMAFLSLRQRHDEGEATYPSKPMKEINIVADKMEAVFKSAMPMTHEAFVKNGYVAP